jgi:hypothetical protein
VFLRLLVHGANMKIARDVVCSFYHTKNNLFRFHLREYTNLKLSYSLKMYSRDVFRDDTLFWKKYQSFFVPT